MDKHISFDKKIKGLMAERTDSSLTGGLWNGKPYGHIYKKLKYNFIDGKYPLNCDIKGNLFGEKIKYHQGAAHMNSSQAMCINYFKEFFKKSL